MGHLDKLNISRRVISAARARRRKDTPEYRRQKLIANIEEQIELVDLEIQGKPLVLRRKRGHDTVTVQPRLWWQRGPDGKIFTQIRYNKIPLNLAGRGTSVEVGTLNRLPAVFRTVIRAIKAGELDQAINAATRRSGSR